MRFTRTTSSIISYLYITSGTVLLSIGVYFFKIPNGFATGGVSGLGTILGSAVPILSSASWIALINTVMFILGILIIGKETGIKTAYCSLLFSGLTYIFEIIFPLNFPLTDQPLLELIYAMLLTSLGSAIIFEHSASSGGTDIIALILKKYTKINVGQALLYTDSLIAASSFFFFGIKAGLFSMLGLFAKAFLVDSVIDQIHSCKYFIAITDKPDEVTDYVIKTLHHSVTYSPATGAFSGTDKTMIHTVCHRLEAIKLRSEIFKIDPHAFVIITTTSEIIGRGFREV